MKAQTIYRLILSLSGIILLLTLFIGCVDSGVSDLVGKWDRELPPESNRKYLRVEFTEDGQYKSAGRYMCDYHLEGNTLVLEQGSFEEVYVYSIDGDILTLTRDGITGHFTRVK